ncbi:MAG: hypothetical protein HY320_08250 [Armatimonadetes bacterium]|nr:hypothetical protein [Armatimonadota bacterium]
MALTLSYFSGAIRPSRRSRDREEAPPRTTVATKYRVVVHPLADILGKYEGEEWDGLLEEVRRNRQEIDALNRAG